MSKSAKFDATVKSGSDWLEQYGVLGMRWGVRKDDKGSGRRATRAEKRAQKKESKKNSESSSKVSRKVEDMSDDELLSAITRLERERRFRDLTGADQKRGESMLKSIAKNSFKNAATSVGTKYLEKAINVNLNKVLPTDYRVALGDGKKKK